MAKNFFSFSEFSQDLWIQKQAQGVILDKFHALTVILKIYIGLKAFLQHALAM